MKVKLKKQIGDFVVLENLDGEVVNVITIEKYRKKCLESIDFDNDGIIHVKQRALGVKESIIAENYLQEKTPEGLNLDRLFMEDKPVRRCFEFIRSKKIEMVYTIELNSGKRIRNVSGYVFRLLSDIKTDILLSF